MTNAPSTPTTIVPSGFNLRDHLLSAGRSLAWKSVEFTTIALLTFLLLASGDRFKEKVIRLGGRRFGDRRAALAVINSIERQIERYLAVRVLISLIVALGTGTGLWLMGMADAAAWGVIAGALNVVPFIGPLAGVVIITAAAFLQFQSVEPTAMAGGIATAVAALEGNLVTPWLTSRAGEVNTVAIFVSLLFWGWVWDGWGLLLAVPITVAIKAAADHIEALQPVRELLSR